jgi:hypothetical protein
MFKVIVKQLDLSINNLIKTKSMKRKNKKDFFLSYSFETLIQQELEQLQLNLMGSCVHYVHA